MMVSADSVVAAATEGGIINGTRCNSGLQSDYSCCFSGVIVRRVVAVVFSTAAITEIMDIVQASCVSEIVLVASLRIIWG